VLTSGCRDGLDAVYARVGDPDAPWAETVLRLCGEILRDRPVARRSVTAVPTDDDTVAVEAGASPHETTEHEGRGRLVLWSSLYGIWLGIATDVLFDVTGSRAVILPPLLGMGAGLGLSLQLTRDTPVSAGQAWTIITGVDYGSINGALWAGGFDASAKATVGAAVVSGFAATAAGLAVADAVSPSAGDIELVRSGLLWGGTAGFLTVAALSSGDHLDGNTASLGAAAAMDAGFVVALGLARRMELSKNRVLIIDAGALAGGLTGLAVSWLAVTNAGQSRRALTGSTLLGLAAGITIAAVSTQDLDKHHRDRSASDPSLPSVPALFARSADGTWAPGSPAPAPVLDGPGRHIVGATFNAVGGVF
jgi:F0F1-type ATP synthase assembly protein I